MFVMDRCSLCAALRSASFNAGSRRKVNVAVLFEAMWCPVVIRMYCTLQHTLRRGLILQRAEEDPVANALVRERRDLGWGFAVDLLQSLVGIGQLIHTGEKRGSRYELPGRTDCSVDLVVVGERRSRLASPTGG